ncbi:MAG: hypothetical protein D3910_05165 [Candidatus Electrothrix sp. ATG2]|nr:hypothetical protein [Candidatus Electrothrix sp. ATG2]
MTTETRNVDTLTNSATLSANINIAFMSFCQRNRSPIIQLGRKKRSAVEFLVCCDWDGRALEKVTNELINQTLTGSISVSKSTAFLPAFYLLLLNK